LLNCAEVLEVRRIVMREFVLALVLAAAAVGQTGNATVEGTVVNSVTGAPVAHAFVYLMGGRPPGPATVTTGVSTYSDKEGRFRLEGLAGGVFNATARKGGYVDALQAGQLTSTVTLAAGETKTGVVLKLTPQAVIAGRVVDEFGEVVQGAQVQALMRQRQRGQESWGMTRGFATTNDRGEYRLIGLAPGQYVVAVQYQDPAKMFPGAMAGHAEAYATTYYPKALEAEAATPLAVAAGQLREGADLVLQKDAAYSVKGRVVGRNGEPVATFSVQARAADRPPSLGMGGSTMRIGQAGEFELQGLRKGVWTVVAQVQEPGQAVPALGAARVEIGDKNVEGVVIRIAGGVAVEVRMKLEGGAQKPNWPMFQAQLLPRDMVGYSPLQQGRAREDGTFALTAALPGKYALNLNGPLPVGVYMASVKVGEAEFLGRELELTSEKVLVDVTYRSDGGRLRCVLEAAEGGGPRGVLLIPKETALRQRPFLQFRPVMGQMTPEFGGLRPAEYLVVAVDGADYNSMMQGDVPQALVEAATAVKVEPGGQQEVSLKLVKMPAR
jgi:protocatechuate 3,4-dioxygenase beta subunit